MKTHQGILEAARLVNETHRAFKQSCTPFGAFDSKNTIQLEAFSKAHAAIGRFAQMAESPKLQKGDITLIESLIDFLEADPRCFGSGYIKATICHRLKQAAMHLSESQKERLRAVILHVAQQPDDRQEFCHYARLARRIATPAFIKEVENLPDSRMQFVARRKKRLLSVICQSPAPFPR